MANEHLPSPDSPETKSSVHGGPEGGIEGRVLSTKADTAIASFAQQADEDQEQLQNRFIDELLQPVIEWVILPDARELIAEITAGLEQGLPEAAQAKHWSERAASIVNRTSRLFSDLQRTAGRTLGPVGAFAMSGIAHDCPKFMHMIIASECQSLANALERADTEAAKNHRQSVLNEIGGAGEYGTEQRLHYLLKKYFISKSEFHRRFVEAGQGISVPGNFIRIMGQMQQRMKEIVRDILQVQGHAFEMEWVTNIPEKMQMQDVIPRAGLVMEVLSELMTNALKMMEGQRKGRHLVVSVILRKDGSLLLKVCDDGPGIGERDPEELFEAGQTTTRRFGGTGMGLTFLRQNIERHFGGFLTAKKNADTPDGGPGMTFACILPPAEGWPQKKDA
ncbi:MAG: ATP-binding protein [Candidatus Peribacteraceae bacterium]|nr:ATP-binding protein [Candidatus Peribacteraceae bacterium]MDD5741931.1 ATP-binding protein [Candidatus Peribacteraceae bacterium]